jgi:hypothetical protein
MADRRHVGARRGALCAKGLRSDDIRVQPHARVRKKLAVYGARLLSEIDALAERISRGDPMSPLRCTRFSTKLTPNC